MGLIAYVYRSVERQNADGSVVQQDCTNGGWSARHNRVCVVNAEGPFEPSDDCPAVMLVKHRSLAAVHAVSVADKETGVWTMMGGNYLSTSDSRFGEAIEKLLGPAHRFHGPVAIHDRVER